MILILSSRYGHVQASRLSATHEEYREARDTRPVIVFIEAEIDREPQQAQLLNEVQGWERGHFTADFRDAADLRDKVIRAMHDYVLANESVRPTKQSSRIAHRRLRDTATRRAGRRLRADSRLTNRSPSASTASATTPS